MKRPLVCDRSSLCSSAVDCYHGMLPCVFDSPTLSLTAFSSPTFLKTRLAHSLFHLRRLIGISTGQPPGNNKNKRIHFGKIRKPDRCGSSRDGTLKLPCFRTLILLKKFVSTLSSSTTKAYCWSNGAIFSGNLASRLGGYKWIIPLDSSCPVSPCSLYSWSPP